MEIIVLKKTAEICGIDRSICIDTAIDMQKTATTKVANTRTTIAIPTTYTMITTTAKEVGEVGKQVARIKTGGGKSSKDAKLRHLTLILMVFLANSSGILSQVKMEEEKAAPEILGKNPKKQPAMTPTTSRDQKCVHKKLKELPRNRRGPRAKKMKTTGGKKTEMLKEKANLVTPECPPV